MASNLILKYIRENQGQVIITTFAFLLVACGFMLQGHLGFNLWDEGYLWYGAQGVYRGEIPIRDFASYDPGRYYWSALFFSLTGDNGLMTLRFGIAVFQFLGLLTGVYLIYKSGNNNRTSLIYACLAGLILFLWMFPRHKIFDISLSIFLVFFLFNLLKNPKISNYFLTGLFVGVAAVFGRNHGVYSLLASFCTIIYLAIYDRIDVTFLKKIISWVVGIIIGYIPVLLLVLLAPGFKDVFFNSVKLILESGETNLSLPIPWPWKVNTTGKNIIELIRLSLEGLLFLSLLVVGVGSLVIVFFRRLSKKSTNLIVLASVMPILPYAHHAFSRADIGHLSQGLFPLLILFLSLSMFLQNSFWHKGVFILILSGSFLISKNFHEFFSYCKTPDNYVTCQIASDEIIVNKQIAKSIVAFKRIMGRYMENEKSTYVILPFMPGFYAMMNHKAPLDIDNLAGIIRSKAANIRKQAIDIKKIKSSKPKFFLIWNHPLDGIEARRYSNYHPIVYQYIVENSVKMDEPGLEGLELFISNPEFK